MARMIGLLTAAFAATPAVMTADEARAPEGVSASWFVEGCNVRLRLSNGTATPIELDWTRSVYAPAGAAAVPLVPGSSSTASARISIPPMVVPPGVFAEETLFRKDRMPSDGNGCLFDVPGDATVTLAVAGGWLTQTLHFAPDADAIARQTAEAERQKAEAEARARAMADGLRRQAIREMPVLNFRLGRVCLEHERRQDDDPCYSNGSPSGAKAAADEVAGRMRTMGCAEDEIRVVTEAILRAPISADPASRAYQRCVTGSVAH